VRSEPCLLITCQSIGDHSLLGNYLIAFWHCNLSLVSKLRSQFSFTQTIFIKVNSRDGTVTEHSHTTQYYDHNYWKFHILTTDLQSTITAIIFVSVPLGELHGASKTYSRRRSRRHPSSPAVYDQLLSIPDTTQPNKQSVSKPYNITHNCKCKSVVMRCPGQRHGTDSRWNCGPSTHAQKKLKTHLFSYKHLRWLVC